MTSFKSDFLNVLTERGFIHQCSDPEGVDALAAKGDLVTYVGYDCTAPSLHVGSLLSIMMLAWLQRTGAGKPIVLMGGGTTRVGDPSGKDETRQMRSIEEIESNKQGMQQVFAKLIDFGAGRHGATMVDNAEWLAALNYIAFLRDVGRHFSVNRMLTMDSAKLRLEREQELSFIEFNYMLLQAYDFVHFEGFLGAQMSLQFTWQGSDSALAALQQADTPEEVRDLLARQLTEPVRWTQAMQSLVADGHSRALEIGPGKVLAGLMKRITDECPVRSLDKAADLESFLEENA